MHLSVNRELFYIEGFQLKTTDGAVNCDSMRDLVESGDRLKVIIGDPEDTINRNLRKDLRVYVRKGSKSLRLTHWQKRLFWSREQSVAIGTVEEDDDTSQPGPSQR